MLPGTNIQAAWLCLMACDLPFFSWSHSRGFQWGTFQRFSVGFRCGDWAGPMIWS